MSVYILQKDEVDFFGNKTSYYIHDDFSNGGHSVIKTRYEAEAKRYTLDDAMTMARRIKNMYGDIYRCLRVDS